MHSNRLPEKRSWLLSFELQMGRPFFTAMYKINVVRYHFWLLFLDPDYDLTTQYPGFLQKNKKLLKMPPVEKQCLQLKVKKWD